LNSARWSEVRDTCSEDGGERTPWKLSTNKDQQPDIPDNSAKNIWTPINQEDLCRPLNLLLLIKSRAAIDFQSYIATPVPPNSQDRHTNHPSNAGNNSRHSSYLFVVSIYDVGFNMLSSRAREAPQENRVPTHMPRTPQENHHVSHQTYRGLSLP
jgi:hypothetical protein